MELQHQLDDFPSGYDFVILEVMGGDGHVTQAIVLDLHTWQWLLEDAKPVQRPIPQPSRYVHHSKNWLDGYFRPDGWPSQGDGLYSQVKVYRIYDPTAYRE